MDSSREPVVSVGEDPVAWLRAQVEARKATAKLAAREGGKWTQDGVHTGSISSLGGQVVYDEGSPDEYQAAHIALNDPQDTIARCEAELAIIADLLAETHFLDNREWYGCQAIDENDQPTGSECTCGRDEGVGRRLRRLASGYRHWPGYREEDWKP